MIEVFFPDLVADRITINNGKIGDISMKLYNTLTGIQNGIIPDDMGWTVEVK
jgi:branched-chain amino acid aminotransferase